MKPILEPHLNARKPDTPAQPIAPPRPRPEHSLGTLTMRPASSLKQPAPEQLQQPQNVPPALTAPKPVPVTPAAPTAPAPLPTTTPPVQVVSPTAPIPAPIIHRPTPEPEYHSASISPTGLPYPMRKPTTPTERTLFESVISAITAPAPAALPKQEPEPVQKPVQEAEAPKQPEAEPSPQTAALEGEADEDGEDVIEIIAPTAPEKPVIDLEAQRSQLRISRFSEDNRMAGSSGYSLGGSSRTRNRLPEGMDDIRVRPLAEAKGQSPIIIPGLQKAAIPRAPDNPRSVDQTRPDEVILFFEEDSSRLETGQLAIIHTDVIELLRRRPELKIDILGYAEQGPDFENLAKARALMLRDYLIRNKIEERRIMVTGRANKTKIEPRDRADLFFVR